MADTGLIYASSISTLNDGSDPADWTNKDNAIGNDSAFAEFVRGAGAGSQTADRFIGHFTHSIPSGSTIDGIVFAYNRQEYLGEGVGEDNSYAQLYINGSLAGSTKSTSGWTTTMAWSSDYGGATDKWGATILVSDTIAVSVQVYLAAKLDAAKIAAMRIRIYYTPLGDVYEGGYKKTKTIFLGC